MNFKNKYKVSPEFAHLFSFKDDQEKIEHEAKMLMFSFLSALEKLNGGKPIKRKDLAKAIKTSPSYVTQLYRGDKLVNLLTLAKIQEAYNFKFEITAIPYDIDYGKQEEYLYERLTQRITPSINVDLKAFEEIPAYEKTAFEESSVDVNKKAA